MCSCAHALLKGGHQRNNLTGVYPTDGLRQWLKSVEGPFCFASFLFFLPIQVLCTLNNRSLWPLTYFYYASNCTAALSAATTQLQSTIELRYGFPVRSVFGIFNAIVLLGANVNWQLLRRVEKARGYEKIFYAFSRKITRKDLEYSMCQRLFFFESFATFISLCFIIIHYS